MRYPDGIPSRNTFFLESCITFPMEEILEVGTIVLQDVLHLERFLEFWIMFRKIFGLFLVIFGLGGGCFLTSSCSSQNLIWCKSGFILTYNRHTGQLEVLYENTQKHVEVVHDTVFVHNLKDSSD